MPVTELMCGNNNGYPMMSKRGKRLLIWTGAIFSLPILIFIGLYRVTNFHSQQISKEIRYQLIDLGQLDGVRHTCETVLGNRRIWVVNEENTPEWFYVTQTDFEKLWPEPWPEMKAKNYTLEANFIVQPLLLTNGYSIATVKEIKRLQKGPEVRK